MLTLKAFYSILKYLDMLNIPIKFNSMNFKLFLLLLHFRVKFVNINKTETELIKDKWRKKTSPN